MGILYDLRLVNLTQLFHKLQVHIKFLILFIQKKRSESGRDIGYRVLHQRLTQKYNFVVGRFEQNNCILYVSV